MRRLALAVAVALCAFGAVPATAATYPPYDGGRHFLVIHGPADPEEFSWEVQLDEGQTLEEVDDQKAIVVSKTGAVAFTIVAAPAHDATGAPVPTSLAVSEGKVITFLVHHRAGNPAADGSPFIYPISEGPGYETDYATVTVTMPPPQPVVAPSPRCVVPQLAGKSLRAARRQLRKANCKLGPVRGERARGAKVARQYRRPGKDLPAGTQVGVKLS